MVHRPRYDDWSWPKGKPWQGEVLAATAAREVAEETGHTAVLNRRLGSTCYPVAAGQKVAHYWGARAVGGCFAPSEEVDELRWLPPGEAADLLSYPHDRALLAGLTGATAITGTVLLVQHAKAGRREDWAGADELRPLTPVGRQQAEALAKLLPLFGVQRVYCAPRTRCRQTVEGLAADLGLPIREEPLLSEEGYHADREAGLGRLLEIAAAGPAVVCSQRRVIPDLVSRLAREAGLPVADSIPSRKGSFRVLSFTDGSSSAGSSSGPVLLADDYYDDPQHQDGRRRPDGAPQSGQCSAGQCSAGQHSAPGGSTLGGR